MTMRMVSRMSAATEPDRVACVVTHYGQQTRQSGSLMDPLACYLSGRYIALTQRNCKGRQFLNGAQVEMIIIHQAVHFLA